MNEADAYIHNFRRVGRELYESAAERERLRKVAEQAKQAEREERARLQKERARLQEEWRRLVFECKRATDAGDKKGARTLLRKADRIRAQLEH